MYCFFKECPNGQFGMDCRKSCSGNCINNESCDHVSGVCPSDCHDGYTGIYCNNCNRFHLLVLSSFHSQQFDILMLEIKTLSHKPFFSE